MVLVDTSIWVNHLRKGDRHLESLLLDSEVACHPFIIGELACGNIRNRSEILSLLKTLPSTSTVDMAEYLFFVEQKHLFGVGIGFVDVHLLASAKLSGIPLWTADKKLKEAALHLEVSYK
jgi:predicted nucleic acid-binding protein